jgi:hypothetical protein
MAKRQRLIQLTSDQFDNLISRLTSPPFSPTTTASLLPAPPTPAYYNNVKFEEITCKPLKPSYDGSEEGLIPFLTRLDVRQKNEGWYPAIFVTEDGITTALCFHFAQVTNVQAKSNAMPRWSTLTVQTDKQHYQSPNLPIKTTCACPNGQYNRQPIHADPPSHSMRTMEQWHLCTLVHL